MIDDVVPSSAEAADPDVERSIERQARSDIDGGDWMGDVFLTVVALSRLHPELELRTIEGPEKPQTLVWRKDSGSIVRRRPVDDLASIHEISFEEIFARGVPPEFNPVPEEVTLDDAIAATKR